MHTWIITWVDGDVETIIGNSIYDALIKSGYDSSAVLAIKKCKEIR